MNKPNIQCIDLKDSWMLAQHWATQVMPSPQRWADHRCCGGTPLIIAFPDQLRAAAIDATRWLLWSFMLSVMVGIWGSIIYMTIYLLEIKTNLVGFSALKLFLCFCSLFRISRLYCFIWSKFLKLTKLKILISRSSSKDSSSNMDAFFWSFRRRKSRSRDRSRERRRRRSRSKSRERKRSRGRRSRSRSPASRSNHSRDKDKNRDRDRIRDRERDRHHDRDRDRDGRDHHRDKDRGRDRDRERTKDKERSRDKDRDGSRDKSKDSHDDRKKRSKSREVSPGLYILRSTCVCIQTVFDILVVNSHVLNYLI